MLKYIVQKTGADTEQAEAGVVDVRKYIVAPILNDLVRKVTATSAVKTSSAKIVRNTYNVRWEKTYSYHICVY